MRRVPRSWQRSADFASWAFSILTRPARIEALDPGAARCRTWESGQGQSVLDDPPFALGRRRLRQGQFGDGQS